MSILEQFKLDGKVALVTGAARGIGQGLAFALADAGADLALLDILSCEATAQRVRDCGRRTTCIEQDLRGLGAAGAKKVVERVISDLGRIDILLNNAGLITRRPAIEYPEDEWDAVLDINLKSLFFLSQAAARWMKENGGGKIINVASMLSFQGGLAIPAYAASKSGVAGVTRAMANEWASNGINVNAIAPGYILTDNTAPLHADPVRNPAISARIPAGRWGAPEDLAGTIVFLASRASDYMHGTIVPVDGGWLSR